MPKKNHHPKEITIKNIFIKIFFLIILLFITSSCQKKSKLKNYDFLAMGTFFRISIYSDDFQLSILNKCQNRVLKIQNWGNIFDPNSLISQINQKASQKPIKIPLDMLYVLQTSQQAFQITNGYFDPTIKPLIDYFKLKNQDQESVLPNISEKKLKYNIGYQNIIINPINQTVFFSKPVQLDLSGILKGYAVDEIVAILKRYNIKKALINGGGNIYALGTTIKNQPWKIGIRDPQNKQKIRKVLYLENQAVATSAGYERYKIINGKKYSQIINPKTKLPVLAYGSATVVTKKAIWADALSTAVFIDKSLKQKIKFAKIYFL